MFINFGGVNSAAEVYVNGEFVGYSEDTFDQQEYNITPYVRKGENKLAVVVYRYCTGSYLEDQDMWRLSGIFRDVTLIYKPKVEIADMYFYSELSPDFKEALLKAKVKIAARGRALKSGRLKLTLLNGGGKEAASVIYSVGALEDGKSADIKFATSVSNIALWSHEGAEPVQNWQPSYRRRQFYRQESNEFRLPQGRNSANGGRQGPFILLNGKPLKFCGVKKKKKKKKKKKPPRVPPQLRARRASRAYRGRYKALPKE